MRRFFSFVALAGALVVAVPLAWGAVIHCDGGPCGGTSGSDTIHGTGAVDNIGAGSGADLVYGYAAGDEISGATGNDEIRSGPDNDWSYGGHHADDVYGDGGADHLYAGCDGGCSQTGEGVDRLFGGSGNDVLAAQNNKRDILACGDGIDTAFMDAVDENPANDCEN
jgi:Ca2+-binding RTX toxin-like protein